MCVRLCVYFIDRLQDDSRGASMKTGKKVNTRIYIYKKSLQQNACVNTRTHSACLSLIYTEFPGRQLAGKFSVRHSHSQCVRWNTSNCAQLTSYFQYSVCFAFCCCGAKQHFEPETVNFSVVLQITKVKAEKKGNKGQGMRFLHHIWLH